MRNIVLIGMPGAGKSTAGVLLAKTLARPFIDTDLLIQQRAGCTLQAIIDTRGMEALLDLEATVLRDLQVDGHVIATGGSVILRPEGMAHLRAHGILVYLALSLQTLQARLQNIATRGIAIRPEQSLADLYRERQPLYAQYADLTIDGEQTDLEGMVTRLAAAVTASGDGSAG